MRVYVDADTRKLIQGPGQNQPVSVLLDKRSPYASLGVQFVRNSVVVELPVDATGIYEVKEDGKFDEDAITGALAWIKTGTGETTLYTFLFTWINTELDELFDVDADVDNDVASIDFMGEIQWTTGGAVLKTNPTFKVRVANDVIRDGDTVPAMPPIAYAIFLPGITDLADLAAVPTVGLQLGYLVEILVEVSGELTWLTYRLEAGPATDVEPGQVEPDDYDSGTNDKHWRGAVGPSGPAGVDAGTLYKWNTDVANSDPTSGRLKVDNATLGGLTKLYISETDFDGNSLAAELTSWDDSTSTIKGRLRVVNPADPSNFLILDLSGTLTDGGAWDTFNAVHVAHGGALTNNLPVRLTFIPKGDRGDAGPAFAATSVTSFTPGTGSKAFVTQAGLAYSAGARVRVSSSAGPTTTWMEGVVTAYSGTTLTVLVDKFLGTGAHTDWNINVAGEVGSAGPSYAGTSVTSFTPGTGSKAFVTQAGLAYLAGARVRASSAAGPTTTWMEGIVSSYSGTTLTISVDTFAGTGAHTDWNLNIGGEVGPTGATGGTTYDASVAIGAGATPTVDLSAVSMSQLRLLAANTTVALSNPVDGKVTILHFKQAAASSYTVDLPDVDFWVGTGGVQPTMSAGFNVVDAYTIWYDGTSIYASWAPGE